MVEEHHYPENIKIRFLDEKYKYRHNGTLMAMIYDSNLDGCFSCEQNDSIWTGGGSLWTEGLSVNKARPSERDKDAHQWLYGRREELHYVLSDIHGNNAAFDAVLDMMESWTDKIGKASTSRI